MTPSPEQRFTDADLKRLKKQPSLINRAEEVVSISADELEALLSRLEASENYHIERDRHAQQICGLCISLREAWRQVAGK